MAAIAEAVKHMLAAGVPADAIVAAIADMEAAAAPVPKLRTAHAERQARYRERKASQSVTKSVTPVTSDACDVTGVTPHPSPTLSPDKEIPPTPPKENNLFPDLTPKPKSTRAKPTRLTEDWVLPKPMGDWALAQGLPRERILIEAAKMRDWSINSKVGAKSDWFAAWRNWVQGAIDDLPRQRGSPPGARRMTALDAVEAKLRQEIEDENYLGEKGSDREADARVPLLAVADHRGDR